jgi:hypothetical protein
MNHKFALNKVSNQVIVCLFAKIKKMDLWITVSNNYNNLIVYVQICANNNGLIVKNKEDKQFVMMISMNVICIAE